MDFSSLGLSPAVLECIKAASYTTPTPIQQQAIPVILQRRDILGLAQTGTGKTASFLFPLLTLLESSRARAHMPRCLIIEPTRELAAQLSDAFARYRGTLRLAHTLLIGGVSMNGQSAELRRGVDVIIATPGRFLDHYEQGRILLSGIDHLVVDEADRMLDMGFIPDIEKIIQATPASRQTLFFSATMPKEIEHLVASFSRDPERIAVSPPTSTAETVEQHIVRTPAPAKDKRAILRALIDQLEVSNAIIFCNRKRDVMIVYRSLQRHSYDAAMLHGEIDQHNRMKTLAAFRNNDIRLLVASDVAARGLDIPLVSHVMNYDVPFNPEDYIHRIGRTGRAGRSGCAVTLVDPGSETCHEAIEALINCKIMPLADFTPPAASLLPARASAAADRQARPAPAADRQARPAPAADRQARPAPAADRQARPAPAADRQARPAPRRRGQRNGYGSEIDEDAKIGMGSHVPAFLLRAVPPLQDLQGEGEDKVEIAEGDSE